MDVAVEKILAAAKASAHCALRTAHCALRTENILVFFLRWALIDLAGWA